MQSKNLLIIYTYNDKLRPKMIEHLASKYLENINEDQLASIIKWFMIESFICYLDKIFVLVKMNDNLCLQIDAVIRSEEIIGNRIFEKKI